MSISSSSDLWSVWAAPKELSKHLWARRRLVQGGGGRVEEEEEGVGPVELLDDLLVVGAANAHVLEPQGVPLALVHEAGLGPDQLVGQRAATQLVEREPDQVGESVEALQLVVGGIELVELAEVRLVLTHFLRRSRASCSAVIFLAKRKAKAISGSRTARARSSALVP